MFRARLLVAGLLIVPACSEETQDPDDNADSGEPATTTDDPTAPPGTSGESGDAETGEPIDPNAPKYYDDILPLFIQNCSSCHVEGGIGPYDFESYEIAKGLAEVIAISTGERGMPPYNADNSGDCHTFKSARWLEQEEIDLIKAWVDAGAPEGDPNAPLPPRPELAKLAGNDILEMDTPDPYQPIADTSGELDDYQCFLGEFNLTDEPKYIIGYEVRPGNEAVTHHMVGFLVNLEGNAPLGGTNGDLIESLDDASPDQPGWDCFGAAGNGVGVEGTPVTWAPGGGAFNFPEGTGIRIDPGYALVLQTHYNLANGTGEDHTVLRLSMADEVEREAVNALDDRFLATLFTGAPVSIPPGQESFVWQWSGRLSQFNSRIAGWEKVELLGMLPHMHQLGNRMEVTIIDGPADDPKEQCGIYVDRWDFNWQTAYMYEDPVVVSPGAQLKVTCEWDSSDRTSPTMPGLGTGNEMCLIGVYAAEAK
jgi:hypothetical protein